MFFLVFFIFYFEGECGLLGGRYEPSTTVAFRRGSGKVAGSTALGSPGRQT